MNEPDFSRYSEEQLRQILTRIDRERYPERVREIEERLAALASARRDAEIDADAPVAASLAGFWRRSGAFAIDMLLLGLIGFAAGLFLQEPLAELGAWGRAVGFAIALLYFGLSESALGGGQSPGMKALDLRVVTRSGEDLRPAAAFLRAAIFCLAYFLNGADFGMGLHPVWIDGAISVLIFVLVFSLGYLFVCNRATRQSIHDLAVGAFVVKAGLGKPVFDAKPFWRGHVLVVGITVLALCTGGFLLSMRAMQSGPLMALARVQQATTSLPGIRRVGVFLNTSSTDSGQTQHLLINATVADQADNSEALAGRMAQIALANYADAPSQQAIIVTLTSGYDIGIASLWRSTTYTHTPSEWRILAAR